MENLVTNKEFWRDRSVFVTGHTGFKGGWLSLWLASMGAKVHGYSLEPPTSPSFFELVRLQEYLESSTTGDIRDLGFLQRSVKISKPSVIFHLAAQPLVRESYKSPVDTYSTNVMGTVHVLESARHVDSVVAVVNVTTDKCYENHEWIWPYREVDRLGGYDPYSNSKACSELVTDAFRKSFLLGSEKYVASARAGNVIGGGDWAKDRLVPDFFRAIDDGKTMIVRAPNAIRPWQHVLEPVSGYIKLAENLVAGGESYAESWNFGPNESDTKSVSWLLNHISTHISEAKWAVDDSFQPHEAGILKLDSSKSRSKLHWAPKWNLEKAIEMTVDWYLASKDSESMYDLSIEQIKSYMAT
jgi:CDP-glucose 4,6-dehydratase